MLKFLCLTTISLFTLGAQAAYSSTGRNVMYYWGQNSAGGSTTQSSLGTYCSSGQVDAVILSFLDVFNVGGLPDINLSNACAGTFFSGTSLLTCPAVGTDIKTCQSLGVKVILSLGGASGAYSLADDAAASTFANTIWNMFGGGSSSTRPFGDAVIDGVDLDIEGGPSTGYASFVTDIRNLAASTNPNFLVGAAPQCPFPDAILGSVISAVGFDYINVQFYNNYCSVSGGSFNFDTWNNWAVNTSPNKNVKIMLTLPGSATAAGSGYVPISTIQSTVSTLASTYSNYGGVSIWDASQGFGNSGFASSLYSIAHTSGSSGSTTTKATTTAASTTTTKTSATTTTSAASSTSTSCASAGQSCSSNGQYVCSGNSYAVCDNQAWVLVGCPSGTTCIPTTDGTSVYCGYATGTGTTCSSLSARAVLAATLNRGGAIPKPYVNSQVSAQISVTSADADSFEAVINARRTGTSAFSKNVTVEFTTPSNVKFTSVDIGQARQVGTSVRLQLSNPYEESMVLVATVKGTVSSGIFVAPSPATLRFK
ncbi:carbohydrate-binding module family 19 protein [Backusella circina FSU 941]|nr:carbohydrate-binding module family 19 protein [Backusella circina FSU 941]